MKTHEYRTTLSWSGSTGVGYENYGRTHRAGAHPSDAALTLSADPSFRGDPKHLNPEQLVVIAASSCQMLSFLAVAARARIDVVSYEDAARGEMPEDDKPVRITRIVLRPRISVRRGPTEEQLRHFCEVAHRECFIANSLKTDIRVEPQISFVD